MSDGTNTLQATVEDYFSDDDEEDSNHDNDGDKLPLPRKPANPTNERQGHSKPPPSIRRSAPQDTASIDSGYSSKTAATQNSRDSAHTSRKARPITSNATPAASFYRPRSSSVDPRSFSNPDSHLYTTSELQHSPQTRKPPPLAMAESTRCLDPGCQRCLAERFARLSPYERPYDAQYAPPYPHPAHSYAQQPSQTVSFPPSSFGPSAPAPPPRRTLSRGPLRPRPQSFHDPRILHNLAIPSSYPPPHAVDPYYRSTPVASGPAYFPPPPSPYTQPRPSPTSPQRINRPQITYHDAEAPIMARTPSNQGHAVITQPFAPPRSLRPPPAPIDRRRRSTSPVIRGGRYDDDRDMMPPPPVPRPGHAQVSRSHSTRRRGESDSREMYERDTHHDDFQDPYQTIKPRRVGPSRPSIVPVQSLLHHHSASAVPSRQSMEMPAYDRRDSYTEYDELEGRTTDAEAHMARTSHATRDPLTAEAVKQANRRSVGSGSRSHKSHSHSQGHGSSERDGASTHISKGGTKLQIRACEDGSWEVEGDMTGHSIKLTPQEGGGLPQMIINSGKSGRETRYHRDGSRASKTSNKSFASRVGRSGQNVDSGRDSQRTSTTGA